MNRTLTILAIMLCSSSLCWAQMPASGTFLSAATAITAPADPPGATCATNLSILPSSTDYWSATNHSQKISLSGTTNVCRLYVKGDTHNAGDCPVYAQIRTAKNGGGTQYGSNSSTNTLTSGAANVVELTFSGTLPAPSEDYFINIRSANSYNVYITYSASDQYAGTSYVASSDTVDRAQDLWLIVCYQ